jgi:hypothetical protein
MPTLDQDRAFAEVLDVASRALQLLTDHAHQRGHVTVPLLAHPSSERPGALSAPFIADLLKHASEFVEAHTR